MSVVGVVGFSGLKAGIIAAPIGMAVDVGNGLPPGTVTAYSRNYNSNGVGTITQLGGRHYFTAGATGGTVERGYPLYVALNVSTFYKNDATLRVGVRYNKAVNNTLGLVTFYGEDSLGGAVTITPATFTFSGADAYVEYSWNPTTKTFTMRVSGGDEVAVSGGDLATLSRIHLGPAAGSVTAFMMADIYMAVDDVQQSGFLGPVTVKHTRSNRSISTDNWIPSAGTVTSVLSSKPSTNLNIPYVTVPEEYPGTVGFDVPDEANDVLFVNVKVAASRESEDDVGINAKVSLGHVGVTTDAPILTSHGTQYWNKVSLLASPLAPNNTAWSTAKINQLVIEMQSVPMIAR